jgi:class 3 adenylate cyclase
MTDREVVGLDPPWWGEAAPPRATIEVNPAERLPKWVQRLVDAGVDPADDPERRLRKRMLMVVTTIASSLMTLVVVATVGPGDVRGIWVGLVYVVASVAGVLHHVRTRRMGPLLLSQLGMILLLPAVQQAVLGGFVAGAATVMYSLNAAVMALVLVGPSLARFWFVSFIAVVALMGLLDPWLVRTVRPLDVPLTLFFATTICTVGMLVFLPLRIFVESRRRLIDALDQANADLAVERARSEALLRTILPGGIAERLKAGERPIADEYREVAVLFADIVGFTPKSRTMQPSEVIAGLNVIFTEFDRLAAGLGLQKVKTIGDAYMVVAGAPAPVTDGADRVVRMGLAMTAAAHHLRFGPHPLQLRVGIDLGPVVAGVIGEARFAWDLYGDVVNTASRMESHGVPGRIQVTATVRDTLADRYSFTDRGFIDVKGKGRQRTFLVEQHAGSSPEAWMVPGA